MRDEQRRQLLRLHLIERHWRHALCRITNDLVRRVWEHKEKAADGFTKKYGVDHLVFFEQFDDLENARKRERRLKHYNRAWKISLIEEKNPNWEDLYPVIASP